MVRLDEKEGVWDNTTVVLASDHSAGDDPAYSKIFTDAGMGTGAARSNALLLVKKQDKQENSRLTMRL